MDGPPESEQGATRTDGFPVRAGECGVFPQLLFEPRIAACGADPTYSRTQEVLAVHGLVPQWSRLPQPRIQWVKSGRCQYTSGDRPGPERLLRCATCAARTCIARR